MLQSHPSRPSMPKVALVALGACWLGAWLGAWPVSVGEARARPLNRVEAVPSAGATLTFSANGPDRRAITIADVPGDDETFNLLQCALIRGSLDLSSTDELWDCKLPRHRQTPTGAVTRLHVQAPEGDAGDHSSNPDQGEAVVPSPDRMTRMRAEPWPLIVGLATFAVAGFFAASVLGPRT